MPKSKQNQIVLFGLGTKMTGLHHLLNDTSIIPMCNIFCIVSDSHSNKGELLLNGTKSFKDVPMINLGGSP